MELNKDFIDISDLIQKEFDRNLNLYGDRIKCRKGCSRCCHQIFKITLADEFIIKEYVSELTNDNKKLLIDRSIEYLRQSEIILNEDEFYVKPKLACPALDEDGACMIYEARPVICRRFGPPVYDYKNPGKLFACELNFNTGEEISDPELIPNQTLIGKKWDELKTEFNKVINAKENASTTIAEAIASS